MFTDTAEKLDIGCGSSCSLIHDNSGSHRICAMWVPNRLTDEHKEERSVYRDIKRKKRHFRNGLSQVMIQGCNIMNMLAKVITQDQKIEKCAFCQQNDVDCFRTLMGQSSSTVRNMDRRSLFPDIAPCFKRK
jgi:hypothetical protein